MSARRRSAMRLGVLASAATLVLLMSGCTDSLEALRTITPQGDRIADLFLLTLAISAVVLLLVFALLGWAILRFRGEGLPSGSTGNKRLEITWTVIPLLILALLYVLTVRTIMAVSDEADDALTVRAVGYQWWWSLEYPELGVIAANEIHLPVGTPIRLELTSNDVIHNMWIQELGWKLDMVPGKTNTMTFTIQEAGVYDGACAEFCGTQHAWMRIRLVAEPPEQFQAWAQDQARPAASPTSQLARSGEQLFVENACASCHAIRGTAANGQVGPDLTHFGSRYSIGAGVIVNTPENLAAWLRNPHAIKPGVLMPGYGTLSDEELEALVVYLEGLE